MLQNDCITYGLLIRQITGSIFLNSVEGCMYDIEESRWRSVKFIYIKYIYQCRYFQVNVNVETCTVDSYTTYGV